MKQIIKKQKIRVFSLSIILMAVIFAEIFMQSCSNGEDIIGNLEEYEEKIPLSLFNYFKSPDYSDLSKNFQINTNNIDFNNIAVENYEDINVVLYYLPVNQNRKNIGLLCVVSKNDGSIYKSVYEDRTEMSNKDSGKMSIYTSQGFLVADFNYKKESDKEYRLRINNVASGNFIRLKSGVELDWPTPNDSWTTCLSKCYSAATTSCANDPNCSFLLSVSNGVDYVGTLSIAAACAIYCAFD
jgi:hypothetical protein